MNTKRLAAAGLALCTSACVTTHHAGPVITPAALQRIHDENSGQPVETEVFAGALGAQTEAPDARRPVHLIDVPGDGTALVLSRDRAEHIILARQIGYVDVVSHSKGAGHGVRTGALIGLCAGLLFAALEYADPSDHPSILGAPVSREAAAVAFGLGFGLPAMVLGAAIGGATGETERYTFGPPDVAATERKSSTP